MDVADVYKCMQTHTNANAHMHMCKRSVLAMTNGHLLALLEQLKL